MACAAAAGKAATASAPGRARRCSPTTSRRTDATPERTTRRSTEASNPKAKPKEQLLPPREHALVRKPAFLEQRVRDAVAAAEAEQDVLGADVAVAELLRFAQRELQRPLRSRQ